MNDIARLRAYRSEGKSIDPHELIGWYARYRIDKYDDLDLTRPPAPGFWERQVKRRLFGRFHVPDLSPYERWARGLLVPDDYVEGEFNLLTTVGATDLLTALVTSNGLGSTTGFWGAANAGVGVGDSNTAAAAGQTDLQAAVGTKLNAADVTSASNATPIVVAGTYSPVPTVGQVVTLSGFSGAGASAINQTFELSAASASSITLLNSAGSGAITVAGGLVKPILRYLQILNGAPVVSTNTVQFVAVFGATAANHSWAEICTVLGQSATNKQAAPPTKMLNRFVQANGVKASGSWTYTQTVTIS